MNDLNEFEKVFESLATLITAYAFIAIIIGLVSSIVFGLLASSIATKKGYSGAGYFFLAFFFNIVGLLVVIGLPDRILQSQNQQIIQLLSQRQGEITQL